MNKKLIILGFFMIIFTGCTVDYNINIDNVVKENISINLDQDEDENIDIYSGQTAEPVSFISRIKEINDTPTSVLSNQHVDIYDSQNKVEGTLYYDSKINKKGNYSLSLKSNFGLENLEYLNSVKNCYAKFVVLRNGNYVTLTTSEKNMCFEIYPILDKININVKTRYNVIDSNAMSIDKKNKTYTWTIDRGNYKNQYIYLKFDKSISSKSSKFSIFEVLGFVFSSILVICGIIYLFVRHLIKKNNKI